MAQYNPADYGLPPDTTQTSFSPQNGFATQTDYKRKLKFRSLTKKLLTKILIFRPKELKK